MPCTLSGVENSACVSVIEKLLLDPLFFLILRPVEVVSKRVIPTPLISEYKFTPEELVLRRFIGLDAPVVQRLIVISFASWINTSFELLFRRRKVSPITYMLPALPPR